MQLRGNISRRRRAGGCAGLVVLATILAMAAPAWAAPKWVLVYYRQLGNSLNANSLTIENHLWYDSGVKGTWIGVTNQSNAGISIFGTTDAYGHNRLNPLDTGNCTYDIRINDGATPTDNTPNFYWQNQYKGWPQFYSYVTQWMRVSAASAVTAFPQNPVYHYDHVNGLNSVTGFGANCNPQNWIEASGASSDGMELVSGWSTYQAQTFVVPAGINRIVSVQAFLTRDGSTKFTYIATIRQGSPTGTQIGPSSTSREMNNGEFREGLVSWGVNDIPVTPGQTYALRLEATDGGGFNVYRTLSDTVSGGSLWNGTTNVGNRDMVAVVVGVGYDPQLRIIRSPASFSHTIVRGNSLANDSFTIASGGVGDLVYTIGSNASWLVANPADGNSTGETDTISVQYYPTTLVAGAYTGTLTISAPGASNTPQTVVVNLTVTNPTTVPCDFDHDGDVDQVDFGLFQACLTGVGVPYTDPACAGGDLNGDLDVDAADTESFVHCYTGPNGVADPLCVFQ